MRWASICETSLRLTIHVFIFDVFMRYVMNIFHRMVQTLFCGLAVMDMQIAGFGAEMLPACELSELACQTAKQPNLLTVAYCVQHHFIRSNLCWSIFACEKCWREEGTDS